jgi:phospholipid transport system substrate-binding protein
MRLTHPASLLGLVLALATFAPSAATQPPDQAIRETTDQLRSKIQSNRSLYESNSERFFSDVEAIVVPRFDTRYIGQVILGTHWRTATESQRERFITAFKNNLVHSYARALLKHADTVELKWKPVHTAATAKDAAVKVDLVRKEGPPIPITFSVHQVGGEWKVYDVSIENISLASTFRSQYNPVIKKNGLERLIERLETGGKPIEKLPAS